MATWAPSACSPRALVNPNFTIAAVVVRAAGGFTWQLLREWSMPSQETCATVLRTACKQGTASPQYQSAMLWPFTGFKCAS